MFGLIGPMGTLIWVGNTQKPACPSQSAVPTATPVPAAANEQALLRPGGGVSGRTVMSEVGCGVFMKGPILSTFPAFYFSPDFHKEMFVSVQFYVLSSASYELHEIQVVLVTVRLGLVNINRPLF